MNTFTPDYQIKLLAVLCLDKEFFSEVISHLEVTHFTLQVSQWLYEVTVKHYLEFKQLPTVTVIEQEYSNYDMPFLPEEMPLYTVFLTYLRTGTVQEAEYVKASSRKFITSRVIKTILNEHADVIDAGDVDSLIGQLKKDTSGLVKSTSVLASPFTFAVENLIDIYNEAGGIRTGIGLLDQYVGGLFKKELTFFLADTNVGKSLLMTYVGGIILRQMRKVLHVTLEMSAPRTLMRYYATLGEDTDHITYDEIKRGEPLDKIYDFVMQLRDRYEGRFFIAELSAGKATIEDLSRLLDQNHYPDVLILDYVDLLKPLRVRDAKRHELEELTTAVRELGKERDIPVLSATQANRTAARRRIVGKELASEDYNKMRIADVAIGMGQTMQDAIRHEVVLYLTKARNDEKDKAERYMIDYGRMRFVLTRQELLRTEDLEDD